jgi:hypothetical protein
MSLQSFARLGSGASVFGILASRGKLTTLNSINLGSSMSVRAFSRGGQELSVGVRASYRTLYQLLVRAKLVAL